MNRQKHGVTFEEGRIVLAIASSIIRLVRRADRPRLANSLASGQNPAGQIRRFAWPLGFAQSLPLSHSRNRKNGEENGHGNVGQGNGDGMQFHSLVISLRSGCRIAIDALLRRPELERCGLGSDRCCGVRANSGVTNGCPSGVPGFRHDHIAWIWLRIWRLVKAAATGAPGD